MNKHELLFQFEQKMGPLMTNSNKTFETSEVAVFINNAQDIYFRGLADLFETDENTRRALSGFVKGLTISSSATPSGVVALETTSVFFELPSVIDGSLYKIVEEYVTVAGGSKIKVKPVTHDQYQANKDNPFKQPYSDLAWRVDVNGYVEIISSGITPLTYVIRYLIAPSELEFETIDATDLPFDDTNLNNIVDIAVNMALNSLSVAKPKE